MTRWVVNKGTRNLYIDLILWNINRVGVMGTKELDTSFSIVLLLLVHLRGLDGNRPLSPPLSFLPGLMMNPLQTKDGDIETWEVQISRIKDLLFTKITFCIAFRIIWDSMLITDSRRPVLWTPVPFTKERISPLTETRSFPLPRQ